MAATPVWRRAALAAAAATLMVACQEQISAPGLCPQRCPAEELDIVDTLLTGIVASDTSFRGYVLPFESPIAVVADQDSFRSVAVVKFEARPFRFFPQGVTDTAGVRINTPTDSVRLELRLLQRDTAAKNLRLLLYRLPLPLDTSATFALVQDLLADSLVIDSVLVADTARVATLVIDSIPAAAMEPDSADSGVVAIAIGLRADRRTAVTLFASGSGAPARLKYFVSGRDPTRDTTHVATLNLGPVFDSFLADPAPVTLSGAVAVGNLPASRALLRFGLPRAIAESTTVLRASLELRLQRRVSGRPTETFEILAVPLLRDLGGKSPVIPDTTTYGRGTVSAGDTGTVTVEISRVLRFWRSLATDSIPRTLMLRTGSEDVTLGEIQVARAGRADAPRLRLTYVRPYRFGVP